MTTRRDFFKTMGTGAAGIGLASVLPITSCITVSQGKQSGDDDQQLFVGDDIAIANTQYGKVQGFILHGIHQFRGIPYGADTSGKNRFMPPQPPAPWGEVRPAVWWGNSAPQNMENRYANQWASFVDAWNYDDVSEDCLKLNVWTPALDDKNRPVLVWLHGGGFTNGNGIEQDGYKGENLSRKGDMVFISINHRLGPIGFSDLSAVGGDKYTHSGNVGALDMVAALEWVRNNIANFGGDPENITIIGQSGGGAKVTVLANMPQAKGLFHKAIALSGSSVVGVNQDYSRKLGEYILKEAGLRAGQADRLQEIPWQEYLRIANAAARKVNEEIGSAGMRGGFAPVADGVNLIKGQFFADPDGLSSDVPLMICTTFHEWNMSRTNPELDAISKEGAVEMLSNGMFRISPLDGKAQEVYDAYAAIFPDAKPAEILSLISSNRKSAITAADAKSVQKAPVYLAWFGWEPNLFNNRMRAFHCIDICFWFANTDLMITHTGGGKRPRMLAEKMSNSLLQFMRTGDPNTPGLPQWTPYSVENGETMILNDVCELKNDPDREARRLLG
jgi:para-nitrobenzyl esterase